MNRFDVCEAAYLFASLNHDGQFSKIYKILGKLNKIGFKISPLRTLDNASEEVKIIYENFVRRYDVAKF